jgi:uncharacterized protein (TIGR02391 family)
MENEPIHFTEGQVEQFAKIIGDTAYGLSGSEIGQWLLSCKLEDVSPGITKWERLRDAFYTAHNKYRRDNFILMFIAKALDPSRFTQNPGKFNHIVNELNILLSFVGMKYSDDGKFYKIEKAESLSEAEKKAGLLRKIIHDRNFHNELLTFCKAELLANDYFHAVLESVKGIASMIRVKTNLTSDGSDLVDAAFCGKNPLLLINDFKLETEQSEQRGFANLLKGLFGTFRNPTAHAPRIEWAMDEQDALDLFAMASYAYRRIDKAVLNLNSSNQ